MKTIRTLCILSALVAVWQISGCYHVNKDAKALSEARMQGVRDAYRTIETYSPALIENYCES